MGRGRRYNNWGGVVILIIAIISVREVSAATEQYVLVRKDPTCTDCILWNGYYPGNYNQAAVTEILDKIGTRGGDGRKLGIGTLFFYMDIPLGNLSQSLDNLLALSRSENMPIFIAFDGFQWWENRSDLWNWWDPTLGGYDVNNRANVEWTGWEETKAIKIAWRNWGKQLRVRPHPNLASGEFVEANKSILGQLLPKVVGWYQGLTEDDKDLLAGISLGNEIDIGVNYYHYFGGNDLLNRDAGGDPVTGLAGSAQLGYAAVKTAGIKSSGVLTSNDLDEVIRRYLGELTEYAYDLGIPRNKIFNHVGGGGLAPFDLPDNLVFSGPGAALGQFAAPGWSMYGPVTTSPESFPEFNTALDQIGMATWASPEWWTDATDEEGWEEALRGTLSYRNNRFINVANWEALRNSEMAVGAVRTILNEDPGCLVGEPRLGAVTTAGDKTTFRWTAGLNNQGAYLVVSSSEEMGTDGALTLRNIVNLNVSGKESYERAGLTGQYYWQVVGDGCNPVARRVSEVGEGRVVTPTPTKTPTPIPCRLKIWGDASCDGMVDGTDYSLWRREYIDVCQSQQIRRSDWGADFNGDQIVDGIDYSIWRREYLDK